MEKQVLKAAVEDYSSLDPRARIIAAARDVFIEQGLDLATVREITLRANVNVAAVSYYFGSKDELISEVLNIMMEPYTKARVAALDACEAATAPSPPTLAQVAEALVRPMVQFSRDGSGGRPLTRLLLQIRSRPREVTTRFFVRRVDPAVFRFIDAFGRAVPTLTRTETFWRYNFSIGSIMQILIDSDHATLRLKQLSGGLCDTDDDEEIIFQLVTYICAGFSAPAARPGQR